MATGNSRKSGFGPLIADFVDVLYPSERVILFDDFLGDVLSDEWNSAAGTDTQALAAAIEPMAGGAARLVAGDSNTNLAADGSVLNAELNFEAANGAENPLVFEARVKVDAITNVIINVGLTDAKALELPFEVGVGDALTSTASDGVAFVFDTGAATDNWFAAGVKGDTDAGPTNTQQAPVAATWAKLRIEVDADETARFYIDDALVATLENAVTQGVDLTPVAIVTSETTATRALDVDYVFVGMDR